MDLLTSALIAGSGLAVLLLVWGLFSLQAGDRRVSNRLQRILEEGEQAILDPGDRDFGPRSRLGAQLDQRLRNRSFARPIARQLEQANLPLSVAEWLTVRVSAPILLVALGLVIWRSYPVIPLALLIGLVAPTLWLRSLSHRRSQLFADQLAETLSMLVSGLRGGFSLPQALAMVSREAPEPTRSELRRMLEEMQVGLSLGEALDNLAARLTVEDLDLVATTIKINARVGGNLTAILESISTTIREREKLRREVKVITSMQRMSANVVGLLPPVLALLIYTINPDYMGRLFTPGWTLLLPISAGILALTGFLVIRKLADIKV
ncbi:MAG: type II secretion system F family protein [Oscillochloridaceae bacterium umkhey_bin13]